MRIDRQPKPHGARRQPYAGRGPALLAAILLGLLLIQPALCLLHCTAGPQPAQPHSAIPYAHLLCSLADGEPGQGGHLVVPAFWPSLPSVLASLALPALLALALMAQPAARLRSLAWSPAPPPPRPA